MSNETNPQEQEKEQVQKQAEDASPKSDATKEPEKVSAHPPPPTDGARKEEKPEANEKKRLAARYSPIKMQKYAEKSRTGASGIVNPLIVALVAVAVSDEAAFDRAVGALTQAFTTCDDTRKALTTAVIAARPALKSVDGCLRALPRGAEFRRGCTAKYPWQIAANINARLPESGLKVPAELLSALATVCAAGEAAQTADEQAAEDRDAAIAAFWASKEALRQSCVRLNAAVKAYKLGVQLAPATPPGAIPPPTGNHGGTAV